MKRKNKLLSFLLIFTIIFTHNIILASLKDFKDDVKKEERRNKRKKGSSSSSSDGGCLGDILGEISEVVFLLWAMHNFSVYYSDYPYNKNFDKHFVNYIKKKENKITDISFSDKNDENANSASSHLKTIQKKDNTYSLVDKNTQKDVLESTDNIKPSRSLKETTTYKNYYYSINGGGLRTKENGSGYFGKITGRFWKIIGPEIDLLRIKDDEDHLDYYALGINLPVFQNDYISPDFYIQRAMFRGILSRNGVAYGVKIKSYPVKPFSLIIKYGAINFEYINFIDFESRLGISYKHLELFIGYRLFKAEYAKINAGLAGINIHI